MFLAVPLAQVPLVVVNKKGLDATIAALCA